MSSHLFHPSIGGVETVSRILAEQFDKNRHQVIVITQSQSETDAGHGYQVVRRPSWLKTIQLIQWCDVFFHNNISLKTAWPLAAIPRPWVIAHHTWLTRTNGSQGWQDYLKRLAIRNATNISISKAIADSLPFKSHIVPDPYDADIFGKNQKSIRNRELVFVGRLVSDKGVDLLINAMAALKQRQILPHLTIIGSGPEEGMLRQMVVSQSLEHQVQFAGVKQGPELAECLNLHKIIVIPSRWKEPFGIVALEGIACGCVPIGSSGGGLPEAMGPCGVTFPNGDAEALAECIEDLLTHKEKLETLSENATAHLEKHKPSIVANQYLRLFETAGSREKAR